MSMYQREPVKLEGEARRSVDQAQADVAKSIDVARKLILASVGHESAQRASSGQGEGDGDETAIYYAGVHVLVIHGPEYCYVYDGDAGVCRSCTPEEEAASQ